MSTVEEVKVTGRKYRLWDAVNNVWKKISYWTAASDVEFEDGENLVDKVTDIETNLSDTSTELSEDISKLQETVSNDFVRKEDLVFSLEGNVLTITKTY